MKNVNVIEFDGRRVAVSSEFLIDANLSKSQKVPTPLWPCAMMLQAKVMCSEIMTIIKFMICFSAESTIKAPVTKQLPKIILQYFESEILFCDIFR